MLPLTAEVDFEKVKIELITIAPGVNYWEAYGHSALRIKTNNMDYLYGFGYFNFADEDFFLKFAKGEMQYYLGIEETNLELDDYTQQRRKIWSQELQLSAIQKNKLLNKLRHLSQAENRYYHYDYFLNNCTSQIRDILNDITDGEIAQQLKGVNTPTSWNDATFPVSNQAWMNLGIALGYGLPAYTKRDKWQLSIFPIDFAQDIVVLKTQSNWNTDLEIIYQPDKSKVVQPSFIKTHYAMLVSVLVLILGLVFKLTRKFTRNFWLIAQSILGVALFMLWFFTKHTVAAYNINVLLFFPLSFILIFQKFKGKTYSNLFLLVNIIWLITAIAMTNLYLVGFFVVNLLIYLDRKFRRVKDYFPQINADSHR